MEELHKIASVYYETADKENKEIGNLFFKRMDQDGDAQISLHEFLAYMKSEGHIEMANRNFFKEVNKSGSGKLDFMEAMTLCYIIESGRKFCDGCCEFINGMYFSCMQCFDQEDRSFNLCYTCFKQGQYVHSHKKFLDNYVLLETKRLNALKAKKAAEKKQRLEAEKKKLEDEIKKSLGIGEAPTPIHVPVSSHAVGPSILSKEIAR